jgi:hypothetical protein
MPKVCSWPITEMEGSLTVIIFFTAEDTVLRFRKHPTKALASGRAWVPVESSYKDRPKGGLRSVRPDERS